MPPPRSGRKLYGAFETGLFTPCGIKRRLFGVEQTTTAYYVSFESLLFAYRFSNGLKQRKNEETTFASHQQLKLHQKLLHIRPTNSGGRWQWTTTIERMLIIPVKSQTMNLPSDWAHIFGNSIYFDRCTSIGNGTKNSQRSPPSPPSNANKVHPSTAKHM